MTGAVQAGMIPKSFIRRASNGKLQPIRDFNEIVLLGTKIF